MKKTVRLEGIDPIAVYGAGNRILEEFLTYFPDVKVVARGDEILVEGTREKTGEFEKKLGELVAMARRKGSLTPYDVESLFDEDSPARDFALHGDAVIVHGTDGKPIRARNARQQEMVRAYFNNDLVFASGPAGTGKTYIAIALAVRALKNREVRKIILTRPAVEAGERLGFLPGDLKEKLDPYLLPLYDALGDMIPVKRLQEFMNDGTIEIAPLAYMRGRTLDRACVILDEAQNTNIGQLKMFLTRMGNNAKFIVTGDSTQVDLPNKGDSGFISGMNMLKGIKGIGTVIFTENDIVRHPLVTKIIKAFGKEGH
ncbi:MAG: PhoH family protein [Bacteroidales bacterium]|nr:PhoH family protein [Bacteroidales bacterium]